MGLYCKVLPLCYVKLIVWMFKAIIVLKSANFNIKSWSQNHLTNIKNIAASLYIVTNTLN